MRNSFVNRLGAWACAAAVWALTAGVNSAGIAGDGIPDSWRRQFFGAGFATDSRALATADPDGDGATNLQEYLGGTDPLNPKSIRTVPLYVSTYAGSEPGGRDGKRTETTFYTPASLTFDATGRMWITEATLTGFTDTSVGGHRVRRMDLNEIFTTVAGSAEPGLVEGPGAIARFAAPNAVAFDHHRNAFVADRANHRIRMIDPSGTVSTFAGSTPGFREGFRSEAQFHTPIWIVSDPEDNLFVADWENLRIRKITSRGTVSTYAGGVRGAQDGPLAVASFDSPNVLAFGPDGSLFVGDWANGLIRKIRDGMVSTFANGLPYLDGVSVDGQGNVYAASSGAHFLAKYTPDGQRSWTIPTAQGLQDGPVAVAKFSAAVGPPVALPNGNLLVLDNGNHRIRQITVGVLPVLEISPEPGMFTNSISVTLSTSVPGAVVRYTLDGSAPSLSSPIYAGPIVLRQSLEVKARLFVNDLPVSGVLAGSFSNSVPPCAPAPAGLAAWWPLDGDSADRLGASPGSLVGGIAFSQGKVGRALVLNGVDAHVKVSAAGRLDVGKGDGLSIEAWINPADLQAQQPIVEWNSGAAYGAHFYISVIPPYGAGPGCLYGNLVDTLGGNHVITSPGGVVQAGQFQHVALTYDRTTGQAALYRNGTLLVQENLGSFIPQTSMDLLLGYRPAGFEGSPFAFGGSLDEVSVYSRALTETDMATVFKAGAAGKCTPVRTLPGVAAYWNFDEANGSVAHDSIGAFHGALSPGAAFVPGGVRGNALRLDRAQGGYVSMGDVLGLTDTTFSVVAWVKLSAGDVTENSVVLAKHEAYVNNGYFLDVNRSNPILGLENKAMFFAGDAYSVPISTTSVNDGLWHQLIAVHEFQGNNLLYVDGVLESSVPGLPILPNSASLLIGGASYEGKPQGLFTGWIDDVQIYRRALSAADVFLLHGGEAEGPPLYSTVSTLAGSGAAAHQDGVGPAASFNLPNGGSVGSDGAAYIADTFNHQIRRVEIPSGRTTTIAGGGTAGYIDDLPAAKGRFTLPLGVVADRLGGAIFVADTGNNRIRKISADDPRHVTSIAGNGQRGYVNGPTAVAQFDFPNDLVIDRAGNIYVSEFNNHTIRKISSSGMVSTFAGQGMPGDADGQGAQAGLNQPAGLAIDVAGNLYVTEWGSHRIRKITPDAQVTTLAGSRFPGLVDAQGTQARFFEPDGIAATASGTLYITEHGNHDIRRILPDGTVSTVAGHKQPGYLDGPAALAQFNSPGGLGIALDGSLIVADTGNYRVRMIRLPAMLTVVMPVTVTRSLPLYYSPGEPITVRLEVFPAEASTGSAYALAENLPSGWTLGPAIADGTYDSANGTLKFGPLVDLSHRVMTYQITPPLAPTGPVSFHGIVSADGYDRPISGASTLLPAPLHPADLSPADRRISINETTAYTAAWRSGQHWPNGPDPIPIDYMTRAGVLWKGGESYRFDPNIPRAPLWWVNSAPVRVSRLPGLQMADLNGAIGSATRRLPAAFLPGPSLPVQIQVLPGPDVTVYAVEEHLPAGWTVGTVGNEGVYDSATLIVRWGPFFDNSSRELSYEASSLSSASAASSITGLVSFDGVSVPVGGADLFPVMPRSGGLQLLAGGELGLAVGGADGKMYQVQSSSDLKAWAVLSTAVNRDGVLHFKDPEVERALSRFYRAVRQD